MDDRVGLENVLHVVAHGFPSLQKPGLSHSIGHLPHENSRNVAHLATVHDSFVYRHLPTSKTAMTRNEFASMTIKLNAFAGNLPNHQLYYDTDHCDNMMSNSLKPIFSRQKMPSNLDRAHRNDMENILPSLIVGLIYVLINPSQFLACTLFKMSAIARILHTIVYAVVKVPQPARALAFFLHYGISVYMACSIVRKLF